MKDGIRSFDFEFTEYAARGSGRVSSDNANAIEQPNLVNGRDSRILIFYLALSGEFSY